MKKIFRSFLKNEVVRIFAGLSLFILAIIFDFLGISAAAIPLYITALMVSGIAVFIDAVRGILRLDFLDEKFLMCIASIGAMIIGEMTEGVAVMLFFLVGEYFEHRATRRARGMIKSLMDIRPDTARLIVDGEEVIEDAEDVEVGSIILIRPGERVPLDCMIISGTAEIDSSALTGEAVPRPITVGDTVDSGVVIIGAPVTARTIRIMEDSRASRILELVEEASERKSREENFITKFSRYYTPIVIALAVLMAIIQPIFFSVNWQISLYRALSFLVVSCPCALVISVPMAFFGGIGGSAARGILFKGGNTFSALASASRLVFDKTGTLTTGEFEITDVVTCGIENSEFLALVAGAEHNSNHPIANCLKSASRTPRAADRIEELPGMGLVAEFGCDKIAVGNISLMSHLGVKPTENIPPSSVLVAKNADFLGYIILRDTVKSEAKSAISAISRLGVKRTYILSGDKRENTESIAKTLGIDEVYAELMPEEKYEKLEGIIKEAKRGVVYVGDGINDSPCLAGADVGIAMGERGQDSAIESADVVIMSDNLEKIPEAIKLARGTIKIAKENIIFAITVKVAILALVALGFAGMWLAVFADVGVAVIAILNSMRTMRKPKYKG